MSHSRSAQSEDFDRILGLLKVSLPDDPLIILLASTQNENFFKEALSMTSNAIVMVDEHEHLVGCVVLGNFSNLIRSYFKLINLRGYLEIIGVLANIGRLRLVLGAFLYYLVEGRKQIGAEITWIAVSETHRKLGVGSELISRAIERESGRFEHVYVKTLTSTPWNINFYLRNGFLPIRIRMGRVVLQKRLGE